MYIVVAPEGNEEGIEYWLASCVEKKYKLTQPRCDDDEFHYPTSSYIYFSQALALIIFILFIIFSKF